MTNIHIIARFKIHSGKLSEFKYGSDKCIAATKNEEGALLYDWFIDEDKLECTVVETYKDSDATLFHASNVSEPLGKLMEIADFSGEVFGNASDELQKLLADMNFKAVPFYKGL